MYNNFEISLVVFIPNIDTNHAITYTNRWSTDWVKRLINYEISAISKHYLLQGGWDIEAKSTCHFQIPSAGKDILHEKRPNRERLN